MAWLYLLASELHPTLLQPLQLSQDGHPAWLPLIPHFLPASLRHLYKSTLIVLLPGPTLTKQHLQPSASLTQIVPDFGQCLQNSNSFTATRAELLYTEISDFFAASAAVSIRPARLATRSATSC